MTGYTRNAVVLAAVICIASASALAGAPAIGKAVDVAPRVEETRLQKWPRAAWASQQDARRTGDYFFVLAASARFALCHS